MKSHHYFIKLTKSYYMLEILWDADAQYTYRGKKTLMLWCRCECWKERAFRKDRVISWETQFCWCRNRLKIVKWLVYKEMVLLWEWPKNKKTKLRQLLCLCTRCGWKTLIPIASWGLKSNCWCKYGYRI